jgi:predicted dehydrogenase
MILAKACHDLDLLVWLAGGAPVSLVSTGSRSWFRAQDAPPGAPARCTDGCPAEAGCPYSAPRIFLVRFGAGRGWPGSVLTPEPGPETLRKALLEGPYGRCVYHSDNDVLDQQGVMLDFPDGLRAHLTVTAFSEVSTRHLRLQGTHGELVGDFTAGRLERIRFLDGSTREVPLSAPGSTGHGGGDGALMEDFVARLALGRSGGAVPEAPTALAVSLASHRLALWAEDSRKQGGMPRALG